jgi:hypothetical protein
MSAVTGSASTAATVTPKAEVAIASDPIPQPRSWTVAMEAAAYRWAWVAATSSRVACSRPSAVNSIPSAKCANFARARSRSRCWVTSAAACSAGSP